MLGYKGLDKVDDKYLLKEKLESWFDSINYKLEQTRVDVSIICKNSKLMICRNRISYLSAYIFLKRSLPWQFRDSLVELD